MFQCEERQQLIEAILRNAGEFIGILLRYRKDPITLDQFINDKFGKFSASERITSFSIEYMRGPVRV
jgi:DnaJ family protein C protein 13